MDRPRRKRKHTERFRTYTTEVNEWELTTEIKIEPDDEPVLPVFCSLCKTSAGVKLLALFSNKTKSSNPDIAVSIKACVGLEITPELEPQARICRKCLNELETHYAFWKRATQCNEYSQNRITEEEAEVNGAHAQQIRVCRFCLKIGGKLLELYPEIHIPDNDHLVKIRKCLGVPINAMDPVTKICRNCIQSIDRLLEFRHKHEPEEVFFKQEVDTELFGKLEWTAHGEATTKVKREYPDLDLYVSDSDCSVDDQSDPFDDGNIKVRGVRPELLQLLGTDMDGKNFQIRKCDGGLLMVIYDEFRFRYCSETPEGGTLWVCAETKLWKCRMKLHIDELGINACVEPGVQKHSHPFKLPTVMNCPSGKGMTLFEGKKVPFWLYARQLSRSFHTRSLFFDGNRYSLQQFRPHGDCSVWYCGRRRKGKCMAVIYVNGVFQRTELKGKHNHETVDVDEVFSLFKKRDIDTESTEVIDAFQETNSMEILENCLEASEHCFERIANGLDDKQTVQIELDALTKEQNPEIFKIFEQDDPNRKFNVIRTGGKFKIAQNSYEYRYYGRLKDGSTVWKCIFDSLRHCQILMRVSVDGKEMVHFKIGRHSHGIEPEKIFSVPIGKRMIGEEPLWLLTRVSLYYESRFIVYRDYVFILQDTNKRGLVRWCCLKKYACRALLITSSDLKMVLLKTDHSHEKPPKEEIAELLEGKQKTESPMENLSFKQKLLSFPSTKGQIWDEESHEYNPFYILTNMFRTKRQYGIIYRGYRYSFGSIDQNETSTWLCTRNWVKSDCCKATAIVEGMFESVFASVQHNHDVLPESQIQHLIQQCILRPISNEKKLKELPNQEAEASNILSSLARFDPNRNFEVKRIRTKQVITYKGENFRLKLRQDDGSSLWSCVWSRTRNCVVTLNLNADGKQVFPVDSKKKHNHSGQQIAAFLLPTGKASVYDEDKDAYLSYWIWNYQSEYRTNKAIIYQGYKYTIHFIGNNGKSTWKCYGGCKVYARVEGALEMISVKNEHNHEQLTDDEIKAITGTDIVDPDLLPSSKTLPSSSCPSNLSSPLRASNLLRRLSVPDQDRNFEVQIHKGQMKILQDGYEYNHKTSKQNHSLWRCIHSSVRSCRATLHVDNRCKTGILPKIPKHNHSTELWDIYKYPLGESSIMDSYSEVVKPFWFLIQPSFMRPLPNIIYDGHRYSLDFITETGDSSKWKCSAQPCRVRLTVTGLFELAAINPPEHADAPLTEEKIAEYIRCFGTSSRNTTSLVDSIPFVEVKMEKTNFDAEDEEL
ncbi:uncharacterized protein LOC131681914 [Topomyia yanbarensis]|uniref:uncharacterized protein LOC131681914 n=1 Tax=Topomyia yanbarensis TaxID=2498891 RepID=UPI00273CD79D|nr:uncharacterized protein LOC131681914 [Topomyia yanbarensis]